MMSNVPAYARKGLEAELERLDAERERVPSASLRRWPGPRIHRPSAASTSVSHGRRGGRRHRRAHPARSGWAGRRRRRCTVKRVEVVPAGPGPRVRHRREHLRCRSSPFRACSARWSSLNARRADARSLHLLYRRLQYVSTTEGGSCGEFEWMAVNETRRRNLLWTKRLAPEVARHQQLQETPTSEFESLPPSPVTRHARSWLLGRATGVTPRLGRLMRERGPNPCLPATLFPDNTLQSPSVLCESPPSPSTIPFHALHLRVSPLSAFPNRLQPTATSAGSQLDRRVEARVGQMRLRCAIARL